MTTVIAFALLSIAAIGILLIALQWLVLARHLAFVPQPARALPGVSILKPLCGVDDDLARNLASFAQLDYPRYEVLLGVENTLDPAYGPACAAAARWPERMRVVLQRGAPGLNPKVNQLVTLSAQARHDVLVVSDSNVRAHADYLREIAGHLEDPAVGLVTHPIAGVGERTLGALFDNAHLSSGMTAGTVAAAVLARFPIVIGKSMALRRSDLQALGGFASVKDVLAEDFVLGQRVPSELGKVVAVAHRPISAVSRARTLRGFFDRYARWATIQRRSVGSVRFAALLLLHPVAAAGCALLVEPSRTTCAGLLAVWLARALLEHAALRTLRGTGPALHGLLLLPVQEALLVCAWALGLVRSRVDWRGHRLCVLDGTRLVPMSARAAGRPAPAPDALRFFVARLLR